jgi:hypothetical protein
LKLTFGYGIRLESFCSQCIAADNRRRPYLFGQGLGCGLSLELRMKFFARLVGNSEASP